MMTFEEIRKIVAGESAATECIKECRDALAANELIEVQPGPGLREEVLSP
jgi:hypothetical protein